jgi:hypothetical protein
MNSSNVDNDQLFEIRDYWGGSYKNSVFGDFAGIAMNVEDLATGNDSRQRLENGEIVFNNDIWFDFGGGNDFNTLGAHAWESAYLNNAANNNTIEDPVFAGISRARDEGLDPRPGAGGPAYQNLAPYIITGVVEDIYSNVVPDKFELSQNYPNPFNPSTKIQYSMLEASNVKIAIYNILGQRVAVLVDGFRNTGTYEVTWDASNLPTGIYIYRLQAGSVEVSKKMTLLK